MRTLLKCKIVIFCVFIQTVVVGCAYKHHECPLLTQEEVGYVTVDNGSLYYKKFGQGTPIIVLHGGPGLDQGYLLPQLLQLANNHQLIFYDQRGSGRSLDTKLGPEYINIDQFTEDLEVLRKSLGFNKFILMGHSWAGLLSMQYAVTHPEHLSGLILLNTAPADYEGRKAFIDEFGVRTKPILDDIMPLFAFDDFKELNALQISSLYRKLFSVYFYKPDQVDDLSLNFNVKSAQSGIRVGEEMGKTTWLNPNINLFPELKKLDVPTFILHGRQDIVPVWTAEKIQEAVPNSEIVILEQCGHFPYIEQSSKFFMEVCEFLNELDHSTEGAGS